MFASKVAEPQTPSAENSRRNLTNPHTHTVQTPVADDAAAPMPLPSGPSWDFSKIAILATGRGEPPPKGLPLTALPFPGVLQPKLEVGAVDDPLEREADRVAEHVMRMPDPEAVSSEASHASAKSIAGYPTASEQGTLVQRKCSCGGSCDKCKAEQSDDKHGKLQRKPDMPQISRVASTSATTGMEAPPIVHEVLRSPGQPLDAATRAFFEPRFGHDFSRVRIHLGTSAQQSAREVNANAYSSGHNVVFSAGRFAPNTDEGRRLLAHELAHVVQQTSAPRPDSPTHALPLRQYLSTRILRAPAGGSGPPSLSQPEWLNIPATHVKGEIWEATVTELGRSPFGPFKKLQYYLGKFNAKRLPTDEPLVAAHIIGGEHIEDLGWKMTYDEAPCIGVPKSLHDKWTGDMNGYQSEEGVLGGRARGIIDRAGVDAADVWHVYHETYRGFPELQKISKKIIDLNANKVKVAAGVKSPSESPQEQVETPTSEPHPITEAGGASDTAADLTQGGVAVTEGVERGVEDSIIEGIEAGAKGAFGPEAILLMLPDIADRFAVGDTKINIKTKFLKEGFAKGVAASVAGWSKNQVDSDLKNRVTSFRVQGLEDPGGLLPADYILKVAEEYENHAIDVGYQFSSLKPSESRKSMLAEGFAELMEDGYDFGNDFQVFRFEYNFIDKLAWELRSLTDPIVERGIQNWLEDQRKRTQKEWQHWTDQQRTETVGHMF